MNSEVGEVIAAMARENTRLMVRALQAAGYAIYAINPLAASGSPRRLEEKVGSR